MRSVGIWKRRGWGLALWKAEWRVTRRLWWEPHMYLICHCSVLLKSVSVSQLASESEGSSEYILVLLLYRRQVQADLLYPCAVLWWEPPHQMLHHAACLGFLLYSKNAKALWNLFSNAFPHCNSEDAAKSNGGECVEWNEKLRQQQIEVPAQLIADDQTCPTVPHAESAECTSSPGRGSAALIRLPGSQPSPFSAVAHESSSAPLLLCKVDASPAAIFFLAFLGMWTPWLNFVFRDPHPVLLFEYTKLKVLMWTTVVADVLQHRPLHHTLFFFLSGINCYEELVRSSFVQILV